MTFSTIVTNICNYVGGLTSTEAQTRVGVEVNHRYKETCSAVGIAVAQRVVGVSATAGLGLETLEFDGVEKIERVYDTSSGTKRFLDEVSFDDLRTMEPRTDDTPTYYAIQTVAPGAVTIRVNNVAQTAYTLYADGRDTAETLSGSLEPQFAESFHDILEHGVIADELRRKGDTGGADRRERKFEQRKSELKLDIARSASRRIQQGGAGTASMSGGSSSGSSVASGGTSYTQTGLITFDRDPSAPFAVTANSAVVTNLDADTVDGEHAADILADAATAAATAHPNVTLAGTPDYITLAGQVITRGQIDLAADITGDLPYANLTPATAASRLLLRGSASGGGDWQEGTVGSNLAISATALNLATNVDVAGTLDVTGAATLDSTLTVASAITATAGQIVFPAVQNPAAGANTLDDYEENTHNTMTLGGSGGQSGQVYSLQAGTYVKVGQMVTVTFNIALSTLGTITGNVQIQGLPFTVSNANANAFPTCAVRWVNMTSSPVQLSLRAEPNTTAATLMILTAAATSFNTTALQADLANTTQLIGTLVYRASA